MDFFPLPLACSATETDVWLLVVSGVLFFCKNSLVWMKSLLRGREREEVASKLSSDLQTDTGISQFLGVFPCPKGWTPPWAELLGTGSSRSSTVASQTRLSSQWAADLCDCPVTLPFLFELPFLLNASLKIALFVFIEHCRAELWWVCALLCLCHVLQLTRSFLSPSQKFFEFNSVHRG